jgi:hypothetical protein
VAGGHPRAGGAWRPLGRGTGSDLCYTLADGRQPGDHKKFGLDVRPEAGRPGPWNLSAAGIRLAHRLLREAVPSPGLEARLKPECEGTGG